MQHELGIDCAASGITPDSFKYLGRIHYCSADPNTALIRQVALSLTTGLNANTVIYDIIYEMF